VKLSQTSSRFAATVAASEVAVAEPAEVVEGPAASHTIAAFGTVASGIAVGITADGGTMAGGVHIAGACGNKVRATASTAHDRTVTATITKR